MMCVYLNDNFGVSDHLMDGSDPVGLHIGEGGGRWIGEETTLMQIYIYIYIYIFFFFFKQRSSGSCAVGHL